jgi:hypothetical protein
MALDMILVVGIVVVESWKGPRHPKELLCGVLAWGRIHMHLVVMLSLEEQ